MQYDDIYGFDHYTSEHGFSEYAGFEPNRSSSIGGATNTRTHFLDDPYVVTENSYRYNPETEIDRAYDKFLRDIPIRA